MDKREKTERQRQEDIALHKVLYWMFGAVVLVFLLRLAQNYYIDFETTDFAIDLAWSIGYALPWVALMSALLSAGGFYLAWRVKRQEKKLILPAALGVFFLGLAVCALGVWQLGGGGVQMLTYAVIGVGILAMLYYLYQHDFVAVGLACGLGMMGLWLFFREGATTRFYAAMVGILLLLLAIALFVRYLQKHGGVFVHKGVSIELLPKGASYPMVYLTCGLMAVLLVVALLTGGVLSHMAYYAVPVAWGLIAAVYYTVKLM